MYLSVSICVSVIKIYSQNIMLFPNLKIYHLPGLWGLRALSCVQHWNSILADFLLKVAQFALHFITSADLIDELALKSINIRI
jgi:hypothetical protein